MDEVAELDEVVVDLVDGLLPGCGCLICGVRGAARLGQREDAAARFRGGGLDEAFVLELLERGVDRAGARRPVAATALGDHLDDLVAVHRLLGEERQDRGADVAAPGAPAGPEDRPAEAGGAVHAAPVPAAPWRLGRSPVMNQTLICGSRRQRPACGDCHCSHDVPSFCVLSRYIE